jgi:hypothetical protein
MHLNETVESKAETFACTNRLFDKLKETRTEHPNASLDGVGTALAVTLSVDVLHAVFGKQEPKQKEKPRLRIKSNPSIAEWAKSAMESQQAKAVGDEAKKSRKSAGAGSRTKPHIKQLYALEEAAHARGDVLDYYSLLPTFRRFLKTKDGRELTHVEAVKNAKSAVNQFRRRKKNKANGTQNTNT